MRRAAVLLVFACLWSGCGRRTNSEAPVFREAASETGLNFHHFTGATGENYMPEIMGAGAALFDYDNDGDLDVYLVQGTQLDAKKKPLFPPPAGWKPGNRLFRNELKESGTLRFTDVTEASGAGLAAYGMGAAVGDYNNDGYQDLYVTNFGHNVLYRNNGNGTFSDATKEAGVDDERWSSSAAFFDYDRDGFLDLFVTNYLDFTVKGNKRCYAATGELDYCTPRMYRAIPSRLFHNLGNGKFADVSQSSGIASSFGPGLGVLGADFDGDGWTDIYVANDTAANRLWANMANGAFREIALRAGAAYAADGMARAGMGLAAGVITDRGHLDILVTNLTREGVTLFRNDGAGEFHDATAEFGLLQPTYPYTGFGTGWLDYDNDSWLDLFIANGAVTIMESLRGSPYPFHQVNQLFHNETGVQGRTVFREVTKEAGPAFALSEVSRGAAFGDIDNDGDVDIVVTNNNGPVRLLLNETGSRRHWLQVRLQNTKGNVFGLGAKVTVLRRNLGPLRRYAHTDGSYLSASDVRVHFGLGDRPDLEGILVEWLDGFKERWDQTPLDRIVTLRRGTGKPVRPQS